MKKKSITNETIFTMNWAEHDPRSVKASLNGKSDARVLWWKINQRIHRLICPQETLEAISHSFHARHHKITLLILAFRFDARQIAATVRAKGLVAGIRNAICVDGDRSNR